MMMSTGVRYFSRTAARRDLAAIIEPSNYVLQHLHASTGLEWPVLIPVATLALRLGLTAPLAVSNRIVARRQAALQPLLSAMLPVYKAQLAKTHVNQTSTLTPDQIKILAAKERRKQRVGLFRQYKCQNWRILLQPLVQVPLFISMSLCIRALCGWTVVPGFEVPADFHEQAFLWCHSLATPDPNAVLPLAVGAAMLANIEMQAHTAPANARVSLLMNLSRMGAVVFMALAFQAPSAISLYWLTSNAYSVVQNLLLNQFLPLTRDPHYVRVDDSVAGVPAGTGVAGRNTYTA